MEALPALFVPAGLLRVVGHEFSSDLAEHAPGLVVHALIAFSYLAEIPQPVDLPRSGRRFVDG